MKSTRNVTDSDRLIDSDAGGRGWTERRQGSPGGAARADRLVTLERTTETSQFSAVSIGSVIASAAALLFLVAPDLGLPLRIFLIAVVLLSLRFWGGVLVLVAVQADLFFREPRRGDAFGGLIGLLTVFLILCLLMLINRNRELLQRAAKRPITAFFATIASVFRGESTFDSGKAVREILRMIGAAIRGVAVLMGIVCVSRLVLATIPAPRVFDQNLREWITNETFIPRCSLLLGSLVAFWIVCNEISWRQLSSKQAQIYLRSVFLLSHHADLRMIVRGRLKSRRQTARERKHIDATPGHLDEKNFAGQNREP